MRSPSRRRILKVGSSEECRMNDACRRPPKGPPARPLTSCFAVRRITKQPAEQIAVPSWSTYRQYDAPTNGIYLPKAGACQSGQTGPFPATGYTAYPVRYLYSAEVNSPRFAAGSPQRLGPGSGTMPVCTDLLHDAHHASYNLRHASEPMAHSGHRDSRMDEPATKRRHRVPTRREPRSP